MGTATGWNHPAQISRSLVTHWPTLLTPTSFMPMMTSSNGNIFRVTGPLSCRQILWNLKAARLDAILIVSLWNVTGISAALLSRCLSNFRAIGKVSTRISFTRSCGHTSACLVNRGNELARLNSHAHNVYHGLAAYQKHLTCFIIRSNYCDLNQGLW